MNKAIMTMWSVVIILLAIINIIGYHIQKDPLGIFMNLIFTFGSSFILYLMYKN